MKRILTITGLIILIIVMNSCSDEQKRKSHSSGKTAEIIVVTKTKDDWNGEIGKAIMDFFHQEYEVLSQPEPLFDLANVLFDSFNEMAMFQSHHNILIVETDKNKGTPEIEVRKNVWAIPQRVILITVPTEAAFTDFFNQKKNVILNVFMTCEHERLIGTFRTFKNEELTGDLKRNFKLKMEIPEGFYLAKKSPDFIWIRKETNDFSQGLMLYRYDFTDTAAFELSRILAFRNSITETNISGPSEGSFMQVSEEFMPVISKRIDFNGLFAVETRGLWELENDFMGGPFVNYTLVDEKRNKVLSLDAYVYAPNAPKRDLMMQMESIIYSVTFAE